MVGAECGVVDGGCSSSSGGSGELSSLTAAQKKRRKKVERKRKWHVAQQQENAEQQMALLTGRSASPTDVPPPLTVATGVGSSGDSSSSSRGPDRSPSKALQAEREARLWAAAQLEQSKAKQFTLMRQLALAAAPPTAIVRPSAAGKHIVELPSGVCVLAPRLLDADTASQLVRIEDVSRSR